jgi:hypothetical protein
MLHTDGEGRYTIASYRGRMGGVVAIYKPGYSEINDPVARREGRDYLKPFRGGTMKQAFENLGAGMRGTSCNSEEDRSLLDLYRALYEEALQIVKSGRENDLMEDSLMFRGEIEMHGLEEARKRALGRQVDGYLFRFEGALYGWEEARKRDMNRIINRQKEQAKK